MSPFDYLFLKLAYSSSGAPGPPGEPFITRYSSALTIHWTSGDPGRAPISRYVIEARPSGGSLRGTHISKAYCSSCNRLIKESGVQSQHLLPQNLCPWHFNGLLIWSLLLRQLASCLSWESQVLAARTV